MMKRQVQKGFSLIELITFIVVIGIISVGLFAGMIQSQNTSDMPRKISEASFLANARMQIILMNRAIYGYAALNDPCTASPSLDICTALSTYATTNNFIVNTPTFSGSNPITVTVNVTGAGNSTLSASIYNYANN